MPEYTIHAVHFTMSGRTADDDVYQCQGCSFMGRLIDAIKHAVANQFTVKK